MAWTTTELLASIKRRAGMPAAQGTFSDAELLAIANEQMLEYIVPLVRQVREEYWVSDYEIPLEDGVIDYPLPSRASGAVLRDVSLLDANRRMYNVARVNMDEAYEVDEGFYLHGGSIVFVTDTAAPKWGVYQTLRMTFFLRPSQLILSTGATQIAAIDEETGAIGILSSPTGFDTATEFDIVNGGSPFNVREFDVGGTVQYGTTLVLPGGIPTNTAIGDWVCLPDQSPVPQIPVELHGVLAQKCAVKILEAKQFTEKLGAAAAELAKLEVGVVKMLSPRVEGDPVRLVNRASPYRLSW